MDQEKKEKEFWDLVSLKIAKNPGVILLSLEYMISYLNLHHCNCSETLVEEWIGVLEDGLGTVQALILSFDHHSILMKKHCPPMIKELVTDDERWEIYRRL